MAIVLRNGGVFFHVAKTGGRWVGNMLHELDLIEKSVRPRHIDLVHYHHSMQVANKRPLPRVRNALAGPVKNKAPFTFCFVRNPFDWYESWFKFMSRSDQNWRHWGDEHDLASWHPMSALNGLGHSDFNQFVTNVYNKRPGFVSEMYALYTQAPMSFIGKQENLLEDFLKVFKLMELDVNEELVRNSPRFGISQPKAAPLCWDPELKTKIALAEYSAFIRYGYENELMSLGLPVNGLSR